MIQDLLTLLIVFAAGAYLVWKLGWRSRPRVSKRPDVPLRSLRRGKEGGDVAPRGGGCH